MIFLKREEERCKIRDAVPVTQLTSLLKVGNATKN